MLGVTPTSAIVETIIWTVLIAIVIIPTFLINNMINRKGEAGLIPIRYSYNALSIVGSILIFIMPLWGFGVASLILARTQMRWSLQKGMGLATGMLWVSAGLLLLAIPTFFFTFSPFSIISQSLTATFTP